MWNPGNDASNVTADGHARGWDGQAAVMAASNELSKEFTPGLECHRSFHENLDKVSSEWESSMGMIPIDGNGAALCFHDPFPFPALSLYIGSLF